jgi:hypothetical protein
MDSPCTTGKCPGCGGFSYQGVCIRLGRPVESCLQLVQRTEAEPDYFTEDSSGIIRDNIARGWYEEYKDTEIYSD